MKETSSDPPDIESLRSGPKSKAYGFFRRSSDRSNGHSLPVTEPTSRVPVSNNGNGSALNSNNGGNANGSAVDEKLEKPSNGALNTSSGQFAPTTSSQEERQGSVLKTEEGTDNAIINDSNENNHGPSRNRTIWEETKRCSWKIITHSWLNVLLIFVPVGIAVSQVEGIHGGIVFALNCIAVIPLAGLLAHATESVAHKLGDALGALLNVTFGNAVELIIFIIALSKDQIRIVQASLLGSILANLLLILGMSFFLGGLRFREQIYNSTVTQMSACLLSLSVISLVLPTAFHASFADNALADRESLKISRGVSVILLLVYGIYLLFQLKSHAYMYESTPQHIVDAESTPGPAAGWLESSSSSEDSSSSSSDSDDSSRSRDTMRMKMKKVLRGRRHTKSSITSADTDPAFTRSSSFVANSSPQDEEPTSGRPPLFPPAGVGEASEEAVEDDKQHRSKKRHFHRRKHRKSKKKSHHSDDGGEIQPTISERPENLPEAGGENEPRRVDFAIQNQLAPSESANDSGTGGGARRPFPGFRGMSVKNLAPTVFVQKPEPGVPAAAPAGPVPRIRYGIRRTNSLPDRLNSNPQPQFRPPGAMMPSRVPLMALTGGTGAQQVGRDDDDDVLPKAASIILLLVSTGLVAACAEFLIGSIEDVTDNSSVGETFIGLIVLPIVGNAAEHVTAITVAMKNKMDLAIGVAVGSSIQIALFMTPLVVILGWCMSKDMTLYFTLFETVCLFVSAFIVNFLVLDGRSNYLEGALLCAVYIIIAVMAFFYPDADEASKWGA